MTVPTVIAGQVMHIRTNVEQTYTMVWVFTDPFRLALCLHETKHKHQKHNNMVINTAGNISVASS